MKNENVSTYQEFYNLTRYNFVWNMCFVISILLGIVTLINLTNESYAYEPVLIGAVLGGIGLLVLKLTGDYKLISKILAIATFIIVALTYLTIRNTLHYTTPMWMIMGILFTFFTCGKTWGIVFISMYLTVLAFYIAFFMGDNIRYYGVFDTQDITTYIIEFFICGFGIAYILILFLKTNQYAQNQLETTNSILKSQNELIIRQNHDKDIMLKEIHHRVKNNLQVITSLLRLQSNHIADGGENSNFSESINRIRAMALIHEKMYQNENLTNFNLEDYIDSLGNSLIENYSLGIPVDLIIQADEIEIKPESVVPLALLLNELISNSVKHAFVHKGQGTIQIKIATEKESEISLSYSDNGLWKQKAGDSFGLEIIHSMTEQLEGVMDFNHSVTGTFYDFHLKNVGKTH